MPFYDTDYGYGKFNCNASKEDLPHHEKQPIKLFDIREFVKKKKEEQRNSMMGGENPFGGSPFGGGTPFAGGNPFSSPANPFDSSSNPNPFGPQPTSMQQSNSDELNIDDLIKKIDNKIAELEEEEKNSDNDKDNEEAASEKPMVETDEDNNKGDSFVLPKLDNDNTVLSTDAIISNDKVDFSGLEKTSPKDPIINHDIMDDFLEDLSINDEETPSSSNDVKEAVIEETNTKKVEEPIPQSQEEKTNLEALSQSNEVVLNASEQSSDAQNNQDEMVSKIEEDDKQNVYVNKEEVDKIMNQNDEDDLFDDFFE